MRSSKILTVIGIIVAAVVIAVFIGLLGSGGWRDKDEAFQTGGSGSGANKNSFFTEEKTTLNASDVVVTNEAASVEDSETNTNETSEPSVWEEKFDEIFTMPIDEDKKAEKMLEIYPKLSTAAKIDNIGHILNLTPDEGFAPVGKILLDTKTPEQVSDSILSDLGNRPGSIRMSLLLQIAKNPEHPKTAAAKEMLQVYLEEDYGTDWEKWEQATETWLKENPD